MFNGAKLRCNLTTNYFGLLTCLVAAMTSVVFLIILLIIAGDVELNPGPDSQKFGDISICHLNVHSLTDKFSAIKKFLSRTL